MKVKELHFLASQLDKASHELDKALMEIETLFQSRWKVRGETHIPFSRDYVLAWKKVDKTTYGFGVGTRKFTKPLLQASLDERVIAVSVLPALWEVLKGNQQHKVQQAQEALVTASKFLQEPPPHE